MLATNTAFARVARVHALMSRQAAASDVSRINDAPVGERIPVHRWTACVLTGATRMSRLSAGQFDVVDPQSSSHSPVGANWRDLVITRPSARSRLCYVRKRRPLQISLDGIAKGFAVDKAVQTLRRSGMRGGIVNAGGDLRCFGEGYYDVAVRRPDADSPGPALRLRVCNHSVATSGDYFGAGVWRDAGARGRAAESVTILAPTAMLADALTKAARGSSEAIQSLLRRTRARGWLVRSDSGGVRSIPLHVVTTR